MFEEVGKPAQRLPFLSVRDGVGKKPHRLVGSVGIPTGDRLGRNRLAIHRKLIEGLAESSHIGPKPSYENRHRFGFEAKPSVASRLAEPAGGVALPHLLDRGRLPALLEHFAQRGQDRSSGDKHRGHRVGVGQRHQFGNDLRLRFLEVLGVYDQDTVRPAK